jgi:hypothetical protein
LDTPSFNEVSVQTSDSALFIAKRRWQSSLGGRFSGQGDADVFGLLLVREVNYFQQRTDSCEKNINDGQVKENVP